MLPQSPKAENLAHKAAPAAKDMAMTLEAMKYTRHKQNLNKVFEEYDVYDGRILKVWELVEIFDYKVNAEKFE